jgi:hypothetical protein
MATDQGKTSNMNALAFVAGELGRTIPEVGLTTFRMPYTPVTFGIFAGYEHGDLFDPVRTTPMHDWAVQQGAVFEDVGNGSGRGISRVPARTCMRPSVVNAGPSAPASACSMRRPSARSRWSVLTLRRSSHACT